MSGHVSTRTGFTLLAAVFLAVMYVRLGEPWVACIFAFAAGVMSLGACLEAMDELSW